MEKKIKVRTGMVTLLIAAAVAWYFLRPDPVLAELRRERDLMFQGEATPEQRQAFRAKVGELTDAQRRTLFQQSRPMFQERIRQRMDTLYAMSPEELHEEIVSRVDAVLVGRAEREDRPEGAGGRPGGRPPRTEAQRDTRRKQRLDFIDPKTRAQFTELRGMINSELESRGEEPLSGRDMRTLIRGHD